MIHCGEVGWIATLQAVHPVRLLRGSMIVLGFNGYLNADHDASAALVVDGVVGAVIEEERLIRCNRAPGMSPASAAAGGPLSGVRHGGTASHPCP